MRRSFVTLAAVAALPLLVAGCASGTGPAPEPHREAFGTASPLFSGAVRTGNLVFTSGVIGRVGGDGIQGATRQALEGVRERVEAGGATMADVVKCTVFLVDMNDYQAMNEAYVEFFPGDAPARTAVAVRELPAQADVEVECIAAVP